MRLLYLTPTAAMGGAERVLLDVLGLVRRARPAWPIRLIIGNDGPLAEGAARLGVHTDVLPFPHDFARLGDAGLASPAMWARFAAHTLKGSLATIRYLDRLRSTAAEFTPDIVHSNGIKMHLLGALAKPPAAALVWHFHDYPSARPVSNRLIKTLRRRCNAVIAVSESVATDIRAQLGEGNLVRTIWNSVDLDRFTPQGPTLDLGGLSQLPPAPPATVTIGLVATFARWKGHILFLDMIRELSRTTRVRAYIVGGPLYETHASQFSVDELRRAVRERGLDGIVGLTGFIADSAAALRSLDIVVHASTAPEPFGLVIAEAMAVGRAVVISDRGGVAELVEPERTGLTYAGANLKELTAQVSRLVSDVELRKRIGQAAHPAALERFSPSRVTSEILDVYARLEARRAA